VAKPASVSSPERLSIKYRPIAELTLNPKNPRLHSNSQVRQIARSIEVFGFIVPVLIDGRARVIAGHGRVLAAGLLKLEVVPTVCLEHLSEDQIRAFMIADNRLTENSEWDQLLLAEQFKALAEVELDFELETTGFQMGEIDVLIEGSTPAHVGESDPADSLPDTTNCQVTQPGDLWRLDRHAVYCGSALEKTSYETLLRKQLAEMVFTDPPYNVPIDGFVTGKGSIHHSEFPMASGDMDEEEFTNFLGDVCRLMAQHSRKGSLHYICMDWRHIGQLLAAGRSAYTELKNLCVWVKDNSGMGSFYRSQHELVAVFKSGKDRHRNNVQLGQFGRNRSNVWHYPGVNSFSRHTEEGNLLALHPTVKPTALVADAVLDCSKRGDIILDPFLGSGTTVLAAERTGRECYGLELEPAYVDVAIRRWQIFTGQDAKHEASGKSFGEMERAERK
jgi:DNA modification methylase